MTLVSNSDSNSGESQPLLPSYVAIEADDGNDNSAIANIINRNYDDATNTTTAAATTPFFGKRMIVLSS
eukprot:CAMPEP_0171022444 /NCGR_PEP_ID=MMETSP0736-20130129/31431_1 /TAXON_ID=186038 /ORGANISM="Fragilariopsis kerguelensis, Strain L26-C5" /LENGTH=68 /DNA_ID=CAMNT_0011461271 /DNA_START=12 /DNA_END=214 /DNA_ORIENTATION=+